MTLLDLMTVWDAENEWREMEQLGLGILLAFAAQEHLEVSGKFMLDFVFIKNLIDRYIYMCISNDDIVFDSACVSRVKYKLWQQYCTSQLMTYIH